MSKLFNDLDEREILALAISLEEEFSHLTRLKALFRQRFGDHLPLVRRQDVKGFLKRKPIWLELTLKPRRVLSTVMNMEAESRRFYQDAMNKVTSADIRELLSDLAVAEEDHQDLLVDKTREKKKTGALAPEQH